MFMTAVEALLRTMGFDNMAKLFAMSGGMVYMNRLPVFLVSLLLMSLFVIASSVIFAVKAKAFIRIFEKVVNLSFVCITK